MFTSMIALLTTAGTDVAHPAHLRSLEYSHLDAAALRAAPAPDVGPPPRFFTTQRDHFNKSDMSTWQQAYYVNDTFFDGSGPVFLCVGGEGPPLSGAAVTHSVHCNNAVEWLQETKALMFAVEHRYYGCHNMSACPYTRRDAQPLKWLSSHQALADLATFHAHAVATYGLSASNKWVSFGGSYPGMLAGWFRVIYPSLVHASVSSSAPVNAKLDMVEYNDIVARAYSLTSVGGSAACEQLIGGGHKKIAEMWTTKEGRMQLAELFPEVKRHGVQWLSTHSGRASFAGNGVANFPAQGNDPSCTRFACNVEQICKVMAQHPSDGVRGLSALVAGRAAALVEEDEAVEVAAAAAATRRTAAAEAPHAFLDYWGYQTCTEFGFYQTCEVGSRCFYTQGYNLLPDDDSFCMREYGISPAQIQANINASNAHYGAGRPDLAHNASRILYVNGDVDPWSGLSILKSPSKGLPTLLVPGASHHAWTHPTYASDQASVVKARGLIRQQVSAWLAEP